MKIEQFRQARANELITTAKVLESVFSSDINTSPIYIASEDLKTNSPRLKDGSTNQDFWGYEIEDLIIPVETTNHLRPIGVDKNKVELILNMKLIANYNDWGNLNDPLIDLNFNVIIRGTGNNGHHFFCFHIDKHNIEIQTNEPHPTYHLQYANNPHNWEGFNFGDTLLLDTPRIIHHPVDFILGIGFLTSNFFPLAFEDIMDDGFFSGLYKRYQETILRPYFQTIANHWDFEKADLIWDKTSLCPSII